MDINKKIEHIRQQPEHIKMKYVWGAVVVCMFFIVIIWVISVKTMFHKSTAGQDLNQLKESFSKSDIQVPSISDLPSQEGLSASQLEKAPATKGLTETENPQTKQ